MTPHGIIGDMAKLKALMRPQFAETFAEPAWNTAEQALRSAVHFEFGVASPKGEHIEFADELMDRCMFRLPFDEVLFTGNFIPKTGILAIQNVEDDQLESIVWIVFAPAVNRTTQQSWFAPLSCGELVARSEDGKPVPLSSGTVNWKSCTMSGHASLNTGKPWGVEEYEAASQKALRAILGATVLLMSKDVNVRIDAAPDKLNKKRAAEGKEPVRERRIVTIKTDRVASYRDAASEFAAARACPRMHWRRGHFRRIGEGRVVPVAPTIVNATGDAKPAQKEYRVS